MQRLRSILLARALADSVRLAAIIVVLFCLGPPSPAAPPATAATKTTATSKRVLLLNSFGSEYAPFSVFSGHFRSDLGGGGAGKIDFYNVSLESARSMDGQQDKPFIDYLDALFAEQPVDLVVPLGGPAARFVQRNRQKLFAKTPVLFAAVDERLLNRSALTNTDAVVAVRNNPTGAIDHILQLLPDTKNIAVVVGNSPLARFWLGEMQRDFKPYENRVNFIWLTGIPFAEMRTRAASLPPHSAIFYALLTVDVNGVLYEDDEALAELHAAANAPIFGLHDYQLGRGVVGGPLMSIRQLSRDTAAVAVRILAGEMPSNIETPSRTASAPTYDWRELQRWGIDESKLPAGSTVEFREPTFVQQYRGRIIAVVAGFAVSGALILGLTISLAKRRAAERSLRESEARFRTVADAAPVMIWMSGPDKRGTFLNKVWLDTTGQTLEQGLGNGWAEVIHADDRQRAFERYASAFDRRQEFTMEYRLLSAGGEYRWVLSSGLPRTSPGGEFLGYIGTAIDITERKLAEDQFRQVVEAAPTAMIMADRDGQIVLMNAEAEAVFGYLREELIGRSIEGLVPEPYRSTVAEFRREYFHAPGAGSTNAGRELFGQRKDGARVPVEVVVNAVRTSQGMFALASIIDITSRLQAEADAKLQRDELAHLSRVAMLGELSGSLAHELNQPLTAILSNAEAAQRFLVQEPPDIDEVKAILEDIVNDDNRAGEVIRRLRVLFKKGELQRNNLDLNETVQDVLRLVNSDLLNHNVSVQTHFEHGLPAVNADRVQVQQVLLNLVVNGCDAMVHTDVPNRRLMVRTNAGSNGEIQVSVADHGCGIPPDRLEQVFAPFFTTKSHGMGLGLTVCRTIVAAHGGKLWATNNASQGSTFHVALPRAKNGSTT